MGEPHGKRWPGYPDKPAEIVSIWAYVLPPRVVQAVLMPKGAPSALAGCLLIVMKNKVFGALAPWCAVVRKVITG